MSFYPRTPMPSHLFTGPPGANPASSALRHDFTTRPLPRSPARPLPEGRIPCRFRRGRPLEKIDGADPPAPAPESVDFPVALPPALSASRYRGELVRRRHRRSEGLEAGLPVSSLSAGRLVWPYPEDTPDKDYKHEAAASCDSNTSSG